MKTPIQFIAVSTRLIIVALLLSASANGRGAISVGLGGVGPLRFGTQPPASEWSTVEWPGGNATATNFSTMDALVQALAASSISVQLSSAAGSPPAAARTAQWASTGHYLLTRPSLVAGALILATLQNDTGTNIYSFILDYTLRVEAYLGGEEIPGQLVYYSSTGQPNSWQLIPSLSQITNSGRQRVEVAVDLPWVSGGTLYLLWADDNDLGSYGADAAYEIDNFALYFSEGPPDLYPVIRCSQVEICWSSLTNRQYQVQYRSGLTTNIWTNLGLPVPGNGVTNCVTDLVPVDQPQKFYRVAILP